MPDNAENAAKFICENCDFRCSKQSNFNTHLLTRKHKKIMEDNQNECQPSSTASFICGDCNKKYSHLSGLCRHRNTCVAVKQQIKPIENIDSDVDGDTDCNSDCNSDGDGDGDGDTDTYTDCNSDGDGDGDGDESYSNNHNQNVIIRKNVKPRKQNTDKKIKNLTAENRQMKIEMARMASMLSIVANNSHFQTQLLEFMKTTQSLQVSNTISAAASSIGVASNGNHNTINSNNPTFNMNLFLNEKCKDAMNMKDFVNSIQLNMTDMENVERLGYVEGMSNILISNLQKTDVYKRPVHCSDVKRETIYVKDDNKWERDAPNHPKMTNAVLAVEQKNVAMVGEWAKANPRCMNSSSKENEKYFKLSKAATDGEKDGNIAKVIRRVAKKVAIEKDGVPAPAPAIIEYNT